MRSKQTIYLVGGTIRNGLLRAYHINLLVSRRVVVIKDEEITTFNREPTEKKHMT